MSAAPDLAHAVDLSPLMLRNQLIDQLRTNDDRKRDTWLALQRHYLVERLRFRHACEVDPQMRAMARAAVFAPDGFWFFVRTFGTIVEPRKPDKFRPASGFLPFIPFIHQEWAAQFFWGCLEDGVPGLNIKTRDMGTSWMVWHMLAWKWLVDPDQFTALLGSRVEDLVDKSAGTLDVDTIFGRLEIIIAHLPAWLLPKGFDLTDKSQRMKMWWRNPENGNVFQGESSTGKFGRQRRATVAVADEFDFWEQAGEMIAALRDSAGSTWMITTPNRKGEQTARRIAEEGKARILELPWELHPYKTRAWMEEEQKWRFSEDLATEVGLSWDGNQAGLIYPEYARCPKGDFPFRPDWPLYGGIDFGRSDGCGIVWSQRSPLSQRFRALASYYRAGEIIDFYLPFLGGPLVSHHDEYAANELELIDTLNRWYKFGAGCQWFGDPAGRQKTITTDRSVIEKLAKHKIYVATDPAAVGHEARQSAAHDVLRRMDVNIGMCAMLDWSMGRYKRVEVGPNSGVERANRPVHNRASHVPAAFEYHAYGMLKAERAQRTTDHQRERHVAAWERR